METLYSTVDIVQKLGIPRDRLRDWMHRCFVFNSEEGASGQKTKAMFNRIDVYSAALFEYLENLI